MAPFSRVGGVGAGNAEFQFAGAFRARVRDSIISSTFRTTSRDVARARECPRVPKCTRLVPAKNRNLASTGNTNMPSCRVFVQALFRTRTGDPLLTIVALAKPFSLHSRLFRREASPARETPESPSESPHLSPEPIPNGGSATSLVTRVAERVTQGPCALNSSRGGRLSTVKMRWSRSSRSATGSNERTMIG
jgi:hypothetical protein